MPVVLTYQEAAVVMSIWALSVTPLVLLFFRHYFRGLDFLQMCYLFAITMAPTSFSSHLTTSMVAFNKNLLLFCKDGDFICSNGFPLTFGACFLALLVACFIFVSLQKCCNKSIEFEPVFNALKGFIRWFYLPLIYATSHWIIAENNKATLDINQVMAPAIIFGGLSIFPFFQLIGYKCIQTEDTPPERKWMEWLMYMRLVSTGILAALYTTFLDTKYLNCIFIVLGVYSVLYLILGEFRYKCMERVIFFLGDGAFITLYFIFTYKPIYITDNDLDLFGLAGIMVIDTLLYIVRAIRMFCYGPSEGVAGVAPEQESGEKERRPKVSKYDYQTGQDLQNSRDNLNNYKPAINKSGVRRRR